MEGIWFYWFSWIGWIVVTFFFKKDTFRFFVALLILLLIITANYTITWFGVECSIGFMLLFLSQFIYSTKQSYKKLPYLLICMMIISMSFVSFYLFSLFDPVWVIFNPTFMLGFLLAYLVILLVKDKHTRIMTFGLGVCHGEIVRFFIMKYFAFPYFIGSLAFFDIAALGFMCISIWNGLEVFLNYVNQTTITKINKRKAGIL